jgi:hypothetical protein
MHISRDHLARETALTRLPRESRAGPQRSQPQRRREGEHRRRRRLARERIAGARAYRDAIVATWYVFGAREDR